MKIRSIIILGYKIDIYNFTNCQYMYPDFNGNAEFEVSKKGFKQLYRYLRNCIWIKNLSIYN